MIDLTAIAGLPITLDPVSGELTFGDGVAVEGSGARTFGELADVLAYPEAVHDPDAPAYLLYRGVHQREHTALLAEHGLRYDLTVTLPGDVGGELIKTAGHIHSHAPDGAGYPEIYDVLHGQAAFVLQFTDPLRVVIAVCAPGERILIPPDASHLTVNIGRDPLVVADLVAIDSQNDYGDLRERRGAAAYLLADPGEEDGFEIAVNSAYDEGPDIYLTQSSVAGAFVPASGPLYAHVHADLAHYRYLTAPAPRSAEMRALWSVLG